jgi:hypothetical protein
VDSISASPCEFPGVFLPYFPHILIIKCSL